MIDYKNKKILIVGLGRSGLAAARFLASRGAGLTVTDGKKREDLGDSLAKLSRYDIDFRLGSHPRDIFSGKDLVVVSPGVSPEVEGLETARKSNTPIVCEMELGLKELKGKVVAITGTNGKSTTTELIALFLKEKGKKVWVGGNLGTPLLDGIYEAVDAEYVVLEVSSYQLETTPSLHPYISIWLNATPDHLDRYKTFDEYVDAKSMIYKNQTSEDWLIYNDADPIVKERVSRAKAKKVPFTVNGEASFGGYFSGGENLEINAGGVSFGLDTSVAKIKGLHNRENIAASALAAAICGVGGREIESVLKKFEGLPHRLQFVREINGVSYYDDSKGTNVGAVVRSLQSFGSPVVLIAGGLDKHTGYTDLKDVVAEKVRHIFAIGEAAQNIKDELGKVAKVDICKTLDEAVRAAANIARPGDVVLLSPACASFDMFKDYAHRGEEFVRCVKAL